SSQVTEKTTRGEEPAAAVLWMEMAQPGPMTRSPSKRFSMSSLLMAVVATTPSLREQRTSICLVAWVVTVAVVRTVGSEVLAAAVKRFLGGVVVPVGTASVVGPAVIHTVPAPRVPEMRPIVALWRMKFLPEPTGL